MTPRISVVMGVFNDAACVPAAIESIRAQSLIDWELIIVNDGSTDATRDVVDACAAHDRRIRVMHQENQGLTRALIRGCAAAQGEFIARQDADDVSLPARLERQAALLAARADVGLVSCWAEYVGPHDEPLEVVRRPLEPAEATRQLVDDRQGPPAHGSVMFRRSLYTDVGGYRQQFYFAQDIDLWLRLTERALLAHVGETLYRWRRCVAGISASRHAQQQALGELAFACRTARDRGESETDLIAQAEGIAGEVRRWNAPGRTWSEPSPEISYIIGTQLAKRGDRRARNYLWSVLRRRPWNWRAWARVLQSELNARRFGDASIVDGRTVARHAALANSCDAGRTT